MKVNIGIDRIPLKQTSMRRNIFYGELQASLLYYRLINGKNTCFKVDQKYVKSY